MNVLLRFPAVAIFSALCLIFGLMVAWLIHNNYSTDDAQYSWVLMRAILDADSVRMENLGFDQPHGSVLVLAPFYLVPWLQSVSPYVISVTVSAFLLTLWHRKLYQEGYPIYQRLILIMLMLISPALVWSATSGSGEAIALLMYYLLYRSCLRMIYDKDIRSFIALGIVLAAFFYFDVISVYLFVALLPLLILIVPISQLRESPLSAYIIIGMPLLIMAASWIYFNWIFLGEPLAFINKHDSAFVGARYYAETVPWLREYGGKFMSPMIAGLLYLAICYPVLLFLMWLSYREGRQLKISLVLMLYPVVSIGVATLTLFLTSPLQITTLIAATVMAEVGRTGYHATRHFIPLTVLLMAGVATGWYVFVKDDYSHVRPWTSALLDRQEVRHAGDIKVGRWLALNREPTLVDLKSGFRVIAARGDAKNLMLPFSHEYRLALRSDRPSMTQIAVPNPSYAAGRHDQINMRFPTLYEYGMPGYKRVYDEDNWRVYRRQ